MSIGALYTTAVFCLGLLYTTESCNVELVVTANPSNLTSPHYPNGVYPSNLNCWWKVVAAHSDNNVVVEVVDSSIETSNNCVYDSLTYYDGLNNSSPRIATICGTQKGAYISTANSMFIQFKTDSSRGFKGFLLKVYETPKCGGELTATPNSATVVSPGYPDQYFNNMRCTWVITAENENDTVVLDVTSSNIEQHATCIYDSVTVYNGNVTDRDDSLGKYCGYSTPTFQSSKNQLRIVFATDNSIVKNGFKMLYHSSEADDCNRTLLIDTHPLYFVSPGYPDDIYNDMECVWKIVSTSSHKIRLHPMVTDIERTENCANNSVTVYSGNMARELGSFCGNSTPYYTSDTNYMTVVFKTDDTAIGKGFRIGYQSLVDSVTTTTPSPANCGSNRLTALTASKYLQSPGYPVAYRNNEQCFWTIQAASSNMMIRIVVLDSQLENQRDCNYDFVKVFDGNSTFSPLIQTWCGNMEPTVQSSQQFMLLEFKTDESNVFKGFRLKYFETSEPFSCGGSLTADDTGTTLTSPGYPGNYMNNLDCVWTIHTFYDNIKIDVQQSDIEQSSSCQFDYVKVNDGSSASSQLLGKFCGTQTPTYYSTGQYVTITFHSDNSNTFRGFSLEYTGGTFSLTTTWSPANCGSNRRTALTTPQYLQSPGYPVAYGNNEQCFWTLQASDSFMMIRIVVLDSQLENQQTCNYDYVKVFDGSSNNSPLIQTWCGSMEPTVQSSQDFMFLEFKTDESNVFRGFRLKYFETSEPYSCGGSLSADATGTILTSPGYPDNYMNNMNCVWTIHTIYDNIKIDVQQSDMEQSSSCQYDYVKVNDGSSTSSQMLGKFCGTQTPTYYSTGQYVTITFHSDSSNTYMGFSLEYTGGTFSPCGEQDLVAFTYSVDLTSPNYPFNYPSNADCTWRIDTEDSDFVVSISVLTSNIEYSADCLYDYVEAFDGYDDSSTSLGRWCGTDMPDKHSSGEYMLIKFHTDSSNTDTGFKISYMAKLQDTYFYTTNVAAIVGGTIGGFVCLAFVCIVIAAATKKSSRPMVTRVQDNRGGPGNISTVSQGRFGTTVTPATFQPPPPYCQVVTEEQRRSVGTAGPVGTVATAAPPPPYPQTGVTSDTAPIVNQQQNQQNS